MNFPIRSCYTSSVAEICSCAEAVYFPFSSPDFQRYDTYLTHIAALKEFSSTSYRVRSKPMSSLLPCPMHFWTPPVDCRLAIYIYIFQTRRACSEICEEVFGKQEAAAPFQLGTRKVFLRFANSRQYSVYDMS